MKVKPVELLPRASQDIDEAIDLFLSEGARQAAAGLIDALTQARRHLGRSPASGSPRYAHEWGLPGLRSWALRSYPCMVFYVEGPEQVQVLRVLSTRSDMPAWMLGPDF